MPVYDYQCCSCNYHFEMKQGFDDDPVAICSKCQGEARRLFNAVPIIYKGSGFYTTDHGSGAVSSPVGKKEDAEKEAKSEVKTKPEEGAKAEVGDKSEAEGKSKAAVKTEEKG